MRNPNKLVKCLGLAGLVMASASCSKVIDKTPISTLTTGNFYKTASDAEAGLVGAYNGYYTQYYVWDYITDLDAVADNCYAGGNNPDNIAQDYFTTTALNGNVTRDWQELYQVIANANSVLDGVPGINDPVWDGTNRKEQILGEAKFIRAMQYYYLVGFWGDVPLVLTDVQSGSSVYPSRTPAAQVWAQIVSDLKYADSVLPAASASNPNNGRATLGAADALLAKVYAQMGDYTDCDTYCKKVLANNYYSLVSNYADLFDGNHPNTVESIFEIQHSTASGTTTYGPELFLPFSLTGDTWPKYDPATNDIIKDYRAQGDNVRMGASIYWSLASDQVAIPPPYTAADTAVPYIYKWKQPAGWNSPDNQIMIRLADIILLDAEALNAGGSTGAAVTLLNQVRTRVGLPNTTATGQTAVAAAILNERRLELAFEGHRWFDLLRQGASYTINLMNSQVDPAGNALPYNVTQDKLLFPVPQSEMDLDVNLTQNPGY
jgi:hypothetical protein